VQSIIFIDVHNVHIRFTMTDFEIPGYENDKLMKAVQAYAERHDLFSKAELEKWTLDKGLRGTNRSPLSKRIGVAVDAGVLKTIGEPPRVQYYLASMEHLVKTKTPQPSEFDVFVVKAAEQWLMEFIKATPLVEEEHFDEDEKLKMPLPLGRREERNYESYLLRMRALELFRIVHDLEIRRGYIISRPWTEENEELILIFTRSIMEAGITAKFDSEGDVQYDKRPLLLEWAEFYENVIDQVSRRMKSKGPRGHKKKES
jgi:hypothetical protein